MLHKREFVRYLAVSLLALCVDMGLLLALAGVIHYIVAACIAFLAGTLVHYFLSVRVVFETRRLQRNMQVESFLFLAAGLAGLLVNATVIYASVGWFALPLISAKLIAAGGSFTTGYLMRKILLFS